MDSPGASPRTMSPETQAEFSAPSILHGGHLRTESKQSDGDHVAQTTPLLQQARKTGYLPIEDYALIGNMRTAALVSKDSSIDSFCHPYFDSPSVFCRILDLQKGGFWSIRPKYDSQQCKQQYLPNTAIVSTKWLRQDGVLNIVDFMPRPRPSLTSRNRALYPWVIRRVECVRGHSVTRLECFPAFNYAQDKHTTEITENGTKVTFTSRDLTLELLAVSHSKDDIPAVSVKFSANDDIHGSGLGSGIVAEFDCGEGQVVTFILREPIKSDEEAKAVYFEEPDVILEDTASYWTSWLSQSTYKGRWREAVLRSAITLKLLTFEPTGAIVAAASFSLPEVVGGGRQWDYRFTWLRDASFSIYALIRLGFTEEANMFMKFISQRIKERPKDKMLQIMYTIHGTSEMEEVELTHLSGYRNSKPVRIGNGAANHLQLDVFGELMDAFYLFHKFSRPISWDAWKDVRELVDYVCDNWDQCDMSIWEVRSKKRHYTYSKVMCWVAINRGLRLADKRSLPCPNRQKWLTTQDTIYEEIMTKGWCEEKQHFRQSYDSDALDSSVCIMPLVFFISPVDPRFLSTMKQIMKSPEKGGLTANGLVFRYDPKVSEDGIEGEGEEGAFSMCTLWLIEALTRAGRYGGDGDGKEMIRTARRMFDELLQYGNHVQLFAEEISKSGEALGNTPQAFTHVSLVSAAFNLDRVLG